MGTRLRTGFLLFPDLIELDFAGPYEVFGETPELEIYTIAKSKGPVRSEYGLTFIADYDFGSVPQMDIICVPGGPGILQAAADSETMNFLRDQASHARFVTSVCTGALVLGAAGLLKGYRATTHWLSLDLLPLVGAIPVKERVVQDRNRVTSAGVTAGIDFALYLVGELFGPNRAESVQLLMQYDPAPPFKAGDPSMAAPSLVKDMREARRAIQAERHAFFSKLKL
jgi:cyclohexyl-isocyanide hydratase